jgi:hypothetical protein
MEASCVITVGSTEVVTESAKSKKKKLISDFGLLRYNAV